MQTTFEFIGGRLCLDFANAGGALVGVSPADRYPELLRWGIQAGILTEREASALARAAKETPGAAKRAVRRAAGLVAAVRDIFAALAEATPASEHDLETLNTEVARALARRRVAATGDGYRWGWSAADGDLDRVLWPVAESAAELLVSGDVSRLKVCDNHACRWLFVDSSRSGRRRWCDMKNCGNLAKARRYRERHRQAG